MELNGFFVVLFMGLTILWLFHGFFKTKQEREILFKKKAEEAVEKAINEADTKSLNVIARSINDVVGSYNDSKIYRYVQLDDGRKFVFESVAVEQSPGVYHADKPKNTYIIVDKCLLYCEIQVG